MEIIQVSKSLIQIMHEFDRSAQMFSQYPPAYDSIHHSVEKQREIIQKNHHS
jgi:hypothetical protein